MTMFSIARGEARALWISLLPHAGKPSDDNPYSGRIRHYIAPGTLVAATTDVTTAALAVVDLTDPGDGELDTFDLVVDEVKAALAVFAPPSNRDARQAWLDGDLQVEVLPKTVSMRETGDLVDGQTLIVPRPQFSDDDRYPNVPRVIAGLLERASAVDPTALLTPAIAGRFIPSAKAWGTGMTVHLVDRNSAVVTAGPGSCFAGGLTVEYPDEQARATLAKELDALHNLLTPLHRQETDDA